MNLRKQLFALNQTLPGVLIQEYTDGPSYDALLRSSTFGLVLAGRGLHSYRLLETMNHGTIPGRIHHSVDVYLFVWFPNF